MIRHCIFCKGEGSRVELKIIGAIGLLVLLYCPICYSYFKDTV